MEIVSLRVSAIGRLPKPQGKPSAPPHGERKPPRHRKVWMGGGWREIAVWSREPDRRRHRGSPARP